MTNLAVSTGNEINDGYCGIFAQDCRFTVTDCSPFVAAQFVSPIYHPIETTNSNVGMETAGKGRLTQTTVYVLWLHTVPVNSLDTLNYMDGVGGLKDSTGLQQLQLMRV